MGTSRLGVGSGLGCAHRAAALSVAALALLALPGAAHAAATLQVCSGCQYETIGAALAAAANGDTISVGGGTFQQAPLTIDKSVAIAGAGAVATTIQLTGTDFGRGSIRVAGGSSVDMSGMTITQGGSAVMNLGTLAMSGMLITGNQDESFSGVYNSGTLDVRASSVSANHASMGSSGITNAAGGTLHVSDSSIDDNLGGSYGAALTNAGHAEVVSTEMSRNSSLHPVLDNSGSLVLRLSRLAGNHGGAIVNNGALNADSISSTGNDDALNGGGFWNQGGSATLSSALISGNASLRDGGGAAVTGGSLTLNASRVTGNTAARFGGGIYRGAGSVFLFGTLVARNVPDDCFGLSCPPPSVPPGTPGAPGTPGMPGAPGTPGGTLGSPKSRLTAARARTAATRALRRAFGKRWTRGRAKHVRWVALSSTNGECRVSWRYKHQRYKGTVLVLKTSSHIVTQVRVRRV